MKNKKQGFIVPLLVLVIVGLSATGMYFYSQHNTISTTTTEVLPESSAYSAIPEQSTENIHSNSNTQSDVREVKSNNNLTSAETFTEEYTEGLGYKFIAPWGKGQISAMTQNSPDMKQFEFKNGRKFILSCTDDTPRDELNELVAEGEYTQSDVDKIATYLGSKIDSGYEFNTFLLSLDENSVKKSSNSSEKEILSDLLVIKSMIMPQSNTLYPFEKEYVKGFQLSNSQNRELSLIDMYTKDNARCIVMTNNEQKFTQSDVDQIILTFSRK
jgi:hypothetical protein